jgi:hypothetical protein
LDLAFDFQTQSLETQPGVFDLMEHFLEDNLLSGKRHVDSSEPIQVFFLPVGFPGVDDAMAEQE